MAGIDVTTQSGAPSREEEARGAKVVAFGSATEALIGTGVVVLAILGLVGVLPATLAAVATIGAGAALMIEGSEIVARYQHILDAIGGDREDRIQLGASTSTETIGGAAAVALGVLGLLRIEPMTLLAVAQLVIGAALVFGSAAAAELDEALGAPARHSRYAAVAHRAVKLAAGPRLLAGIGALVLGILSLAAAGATLTLVLVALLSVAAAVLLTGSALGARVAAILR